MAMIKRRGGMVRVQLRPEERTILAGLAREVAEMLDPPETDADPLAAIVGIGDSPVATPVDPALARLLPDAYADPAGAAEFRRLTDADLRHGKAEALLRLADTVASESGAVELSPDDADRWLSAVNDIRLVLGVRLDIQDDDGSWRHALSPDDLRQPLLAAYDWLSMLQELLVDALL